MDKDYQRRAQITGSVAAVCVSASVNSHTDAGYLTGNDGAEYDDRIVLDGTAPFTIDVINDSPAWLDAEPYIDNDNEIVLYAGAATPSGSYDVDLEVSADCDGVTLFIAYTIVVT